MYVIIHENDKDHFTKYKENKLFCEAILAKKTPIVATDCLLPTMF